MKVVMPISFVPMLLLVTVAGCSPTTTFRRAALVPTATGDMLIHTQRRATELSGSVAYTDVSRDPIPAFGDPGLHAARTTFHGLARFRLGKYVRLGAQGFFSHATFAQTTAEGTPPMEGENVWGAGPNVGFHFRDHDWAFGGGLSVTFASVPWTVWRRRDGAPDVSTDPVDTVIERYEEIDSGRDMQPLVTIGVGATWIANRYIEGFAGVSLQSSLKNIGFDDTERNGSTLDAANFGMAPFIGVTLRLPGGPFVRMQYYYPIAFDQFTWGGETNWGGVMGTLGIEIGEDPNPYGM